MFDFDNFREIWSTIQKNKLRTFLTGFSVAWGIFMLIVLLGAGNGMKNGIMSNFRNFSLNRVETWPRYTSKPYKGMQMNRRIEYKDEDLIAIPRENPEVDLITASISRSDTLSYGDEYNAYSLNGVHPSKAVIDNIEMTVGNGRFINDIDVKEKRKVIVLSPRMKEVLFKGEDPLGKYVNAGSVAYQVIGVYKAEDNDNIDTIYVEDENGRYFGAIELKDLITAREYMKLEDIISTSYPYVYADEKSSDCMEELIDYSEESIPVLDRNHKIIGAITYEDIAEAIEKSPLESVEIRSVLTCEARHGVCAKCYGRNLATARMVQKGEVVGVIAAQSIGEPGTQLTLRTFHVGGVAGGSAVETNVVSKYEGRLEIDELRTVKGKNAAGEAIDIVISRQSEFRIVDPKTDIVLYTHNLPYGATLFMADGSEVKKGDLICEWDPYNAVIISEYEGKASYESVIEGITYRDERDEQTGLSEKVVIESKDKTKNPVIKIVDREGLEVKQYNLPVGAHVVVKDNARIKAGDILIKIPRAVGKSGGDITGGLPRVTELFEARNPSNPAIVSEIDGEVAFGKIKRGNREIIITSKQGDVKRYLVPLSRQIIVQENDYVKAGSPLSDGAITPSDILNILGPTKVQEYIVNEVQEVYRMQGVKINDKHFEVIVRQMMNKVKIEDPGDTRFFEDQVVDKWEFMDVNDELYDKVVVTDAGDSTSLQPGQIVSLRKLRDENSSLKRRDQQPVQVRDIVPATSTQVLQGITRAALQTSSFISAASFQETTKVLNEAAIQAKVDPLENLKENVICGHLIPGGTGLRDYDDLVVGSKADLESLQQAQ